MFAATITSERSTTASSLVGLSSSRLTTHAPRSGRPRGRLRVGRGSRSWCSSPKNPAGGRGVRQRGQRAGGVVALVGVAVLEGSLGVEQDPHLNIGVVAEPDAHAGGAVATQVLPGPPDRFQAGDRFGVAPPVRAPLVLPGDPHLAPIQPHQIVPDELVERGEHQPRRLTAVVSSSSQLGGAAGLGERRDAPLGGVGGEGVELRRELGVDGVGQFRGRQVRDECAGLGAGVAVEQLGQLGHRHRIQRPTHRVRVRASGIGIGVAGIGHDGAPFGSVVVGEVFAAGRHRVAGGVPTGTGRRHECAAAARRR